MKKFLVLCILGTTLAMGAYDIKIGVFSNAKNLKNNIQKIKSTKYRKAIIVTKRNHLHYVHAYISGNPIEAKRALDSYKMVFPDAFMTKSATKKIPKVPMKPKHKVAQKKPTIIKQKRLLIQAKIIQKPRLKTIEKPLDAKLFLHGNTIYMCYEHAPIGLSQRIVEMHFDNGVVHYTDLDTKNILDIPYHIDKDAITLHLFDTQMVHKIVSNHGEYLLGESYVENKKMNILRYYYTKEQAKVYLSTL